jgi:hypothetical protein
MDVDATTLLHEPQVAASLGLFSIMDACLTRAFDADRANSFARSDEISAKLHACKFEEVYKRSGSCFARIAEAMYKAVNEIGESNMTVSDQPVIDACKPP